MGREPLQVLKQESFPRKELLLDVESRKVKRTC